METWEPAEALRLLAEAEQLVKLVYTSNDYMPFPYIAMALARLDPAGAERIARIPGLPVETLPRVAEELAGADPAAAESLARTIDNPAYQAKALARIAAARAERLLQESR